MSAQVNASREKDGFLKCKDCPRRFLTKTGFENHSCNLHKEDSDTKLDQIQESPTTKGESTFQPNTRLDKKCCLCSLLTRPILRQVLSYYLPSNLSYIFLIEMVA